MSEHEIVQVPLRDFSGKRQISQISCFRCEQRKKWRLHQQNSQLIRLLKNGPRRWQN